MRKVEIEKKIINKIIDEFLDNVERENIVALNANYIKLGFIPCKEVVDSLVEEGYKLRNDRLYFKFEHRERGWKPTINNILNHKDILAQRV